MLILTKSSPAASSPSSYLNKGFTIVELLIVVVVIAILAAITIVSYNGIQSKAVRSVALSDLRNAAQALEINQMNSSTSTYPPRSPYPKIKVSKGIYTTGRNNWYYCLAQDGKSFAFGAVVQNASYIITSKGDIIEFDRGIGGGDVCLAVGWPDEETPIFSSGYYWNTATNTGSWNSNIE